MRPPTDPPPIHRWGVGAFVVVELVFLLVSFICVSVLLRGERVEAWQLALAITVPTVVAAGTAVLFTVARGNGPVLDLRLRFRRRDIVLGLQFGIGALFVTLPASILWATVVGSDADSAVGEQFGDVRAGPATALVVFVLVVFIAPLCEEIIFRGLLWGGVQKLVTRRWVVAVVTTVIFAVAHVELTRTPLLVVIAIPIALARLYSDGLLAGVIAHVINNFLPGVALTLGLLGVIPLA